MSDYLQKHHKPESSLQNEVLQFAAMLSVQSTFPILKPLPKHRFVYSAIRSGLRTTGTDRPVLVLSESKED